MNNDKVNYNEEPVYFCKHCLSLKIMDVEGIDCCGDCGSTDIEESSIEHWEGLYKLKYNRALLNNNNKFKNKNYGRRDKNTRNSRKNTLR